jgi:glycosyltransferase involved in cell wall biosynthesis
VTVIAPDVTVVMAAFNSARFIAEALESLQTQQGPILEIVVVVDSRSNDATTEIVFDLATRDERVTPIIFDRPGLFLALNAGIDAAKGRYITFLDSDDICPSGRIARQVDKLAADRSLGAVVGEVLLFEILAPELTPAAGTRWARVLSPCLGAGTFRREAIDEVGRFDETFTHSGDIDFLLRLNDSNWIIQPEQDLGLLCRKHGGNMSANAADVQLHLLKALQRSIARRRLSGLTDRPPPFALMKPLSQIEGSVNGFPGHRTADLFTQKGRL